MENTNSILRLVPPGHWYSTIDLNAGYWQVRLAPESIEKAAFVTQDGFYEPCVCHLV